VEFFTWTDIQTWRNISWTTWPWKRRHYETSGTVQPVQRHCINIPEILDFHFLVIRRLFVTLDVLWLRQQARWSLFGPDVIAGTPEWRAGMPSDCTPAPYPRNKTGETLAASQQPAVYLASRSINLANLLRAQLIWQASCTLDQTRALLYSSPWRFQSHPLC